MPTPGERRALIFLASVAALGVAVRGWREFHPTDSSALTGNRAALARQIEAVDSAIAVTSSRGKPRAAKPLGEPGASGAPSRDERPVPATSRVTSRRSRRPAMSDTAPRDPRQGYWDRSLYFDSLQRATDTQRSIGESRQYQDRRKPSSSGRSRATGTGNPPVDLDIADVEAIADVPSIGPALAQRIFDDRVENGPFGSIAELERIPGITHAFAHRLEPFVTFSGSPRHASGEKGGLKQKKSVVPGASRVLDTIPAAGQLHRAELAHL